MTVVQLGAPGVYPAPVASGPPPGEPIRLDVAGFVGIAPRGPVNQPVAVQNWAEYVRRFGTHGPGYPGRLADAVATFFRQGGARAWIVRVAPPVADDSAVTMLRFGSALTSGGGSVRLAARDEGSWGDTLTVRVDLVVTERFPVTGGELTLPDGAAVPIGSLLRVGATPVLRWVTGRRPALTLDGPLPEGTGTAEVVTAAVTVSSADPDGPPVEHHDGLGLSPEHPRWMAAVLTDRSLVVRPAGDWTGRIEPATPDLLPALTEVDRPGRDRYEQITGGSFFDVVTAAGYPLPEPDPDRPPTVRRGVDALDEMAGEIGLLVVPDLLHPSAPAPAPPAEPAPPPHRYRPRFAPCHPPDPATPEPPPPARPGVLDDDHEILARQHGLVARTGPDRPAIALLDVPPHLRGTQILTWRAAFDSDRVAAYHPWLRLVRADGSTVIAPPSPFAAGIIAARELRSGVATGPANELAADAVGVADVLTEELHGVLHRAGINAFRPERDGVRLLGARTLSSDPAYRQLSVRRLMTWVRLAVARRLETALFDANTTALRTSLRLQVTAMLADLFRAGALNGTSEAEAFFVHCDDELNPPRTVEQGRLVIEVGVNPSEPIEYILLRFALAANGSVSVAEVTR
jgi:Bacteriophage tail sheath protein